MIIFLFPILVMSIGFVFSDILTGTDRDYYLSIIEYFQLHSFPSSKFNLEPLFGLTTYLTSQLPLRPEIILKVLMFLSLLIKSYAFNRVILTPKPLTKILLFVLFSLFYGFCLYNRQEMGSLRQAFSIGFLMLYFSESEHKGRAIWSILVLFSHYSIGVLLFSFIAVNNSIFTVFGKNLLISLRSFLTRAITLLKIRNFFTFNFPFQFKYLVIALIAFIVLSVNRGHLILFALGGSDSIDETRFYSINILSYYRLYTYSMPLLLLVFMNKKSQLLHKSLNAFFPACYLRLSFYVSVLTIIISFLPSLLLYLGRL